jgi:preprotein translocase subunit YajC
VFLSRLHLLLAKDLPMHRFIGFKSSMTYSANIGAVLALGAPAAPGTQADPRAQMLQTFGMLFFMIVVFYLIALRPQQKKAKEQANMLKVLKAGDKVVTTSGIMGVVVTVKDKSVSLRSADTKLEVLKSSISEVLEKSAATES